MAGVCEISLWLSNVVSIPILATDLAITGSAINAFFESLVNPAPQFYKLEFNGTETYNNTPLISLPTSLPSGTDTTIATNKGWRI